jgi:hypothetical protein
MSSTARAAEVTRVASSPWRGDDRFDIHFGVGFQYNFKRAAILREWNPGQMAGTENQLVKDLLYQQQRYTLTPVFEIGLWRRLSLYVELPIILRDTRSYSFDKREDDCVFGDDVPPSAGANCVNKNNSTTLRDEIIPRTGFDATNTADPYLQFAGPDTDLIFRGPVRRGIDQLHVGLKYGILSQDAMSHMPNWTLAFEGRFGVGRPMTFSRDITREDPAGNHRVGRRVHELGLWTALSRRHLFLDPFFTAYWRQAVRGAGSKFQNEEDNGAQTTVRPQSVAGISMGTEIVPWERKAKQLKVAVLVSGSAELHYGGRGYSEIWELLADSPAMVGSFRPESQARNPDGSPRDRGEFCNRNEALTFARDNPGDPGYIAEGGGSCEKFEGITDLQDYATFGFRTGLNFHLGPFARLMLGVNISTDTRHFITSAGRGNADTSSGTDPDRVEPGTAEVNPVRRDVVDNVGRRYLVDDVIDTYGYLRFLITF